MKILLGILFLAGLLCFVAYLYFSESEKEKKSMKKTLPPKKPLLPQDPSSTTVIPADPHSRDVAKLVAKSDTEAAARVIRKWLREK